MDGDQWETRGNNKRKITNANLFSFAEASWRRHTKGKRQQVLRGTSLRRFFLLPTERLKEKGPAMYISKRWIAQKKSQSPMIDPVKT